MSQIALNNITIGYDDYGSGRCLLLVHGHPFNRTMWQPQLDCFSQTGWRVVAPDLRGYGESTAVAGATPLETFARDCIGVLDTLGIERFVVAGLSMGGQIVMEIYRLFTDRIDGLILADTFPGAETPEGKVERQEMAARLEADGIVDYSINTLPKMIAAYNVTRMPAVARKVLSMMINTSPVGAAAALRGRAERMDYVELLEGADVPSLVLVGRDDDFTPVSDAEFMHTILKRSTLRIFEGCGHLPNLEAADEFNAVMGEFLDSLHNNREGTAR